MTYVFTQDVPIDATFYRRITDGLGPDTPDGLILHLAVEKPAGGLRYIDVWESQEACDRFTDDRRHPVVHGLLREIFGGELPAEPQRTELPVVHAWGSALTEAQG